jgi:hypothetical protein
MSSKELVHRGKKRFWSGKVDTLCGLVFSEDCEPEGGVFLKPSVDCPGCKAAEKAGKRL